MADTPRDPLAAHAPTWYPEAGEWCCIAHGRDATRPTDDAALPSITELAGALYETDPPESWMRTGTDEYRKRAAAMLAFIREDRAAHDTPEDDARG